MNFSMWWLFFFGITVIVTVTVAADDTDFIPCPLVWVPVSAGEVVSPRSVPTTSFGDTHFIARSRSSSGRIIVGRFENAGSCLIAVRGSGLVEAPDSCELLTNP